MYTVLSLGAGNYPCVYNCERKDSYGEAMDLAVKLCKEQGATESEEEIRNELKDEGIYVPSKHSEWSVCVWSH